MKVMIKRDTLVRVSAGEILELPETEAKRLMVLGNAEAVEEKKKAAKK